MTWGELTKVILKGLTICLGDQNQKVDFAYILASVYFIKKCEQVLCWNLPRRDNIKLGTKIYEI